MVRDIEPKLGRRHWGDMEIQNWDLKLLKWFCSDIQDGHHDNHFENLQMTSAPEQYVWLSLNLMGGIGM